MAVLPDDDALRAAVRGACSGAADADAALARTRAALIPGVSAIAEQDAIRVLVREVDPYPLDDDYAVQDWRAVTLELAAARAASTEGASWDIKAVAEKVEALARSRAQRDAALARQRDEEEARRRHEAEAAEARAATEARAAGRRWLVVAQGLGMAGVAEAQESFEEDLDCAERALALHRADLARCDELARRRRKGLLLAVGVGLGACVLAGRYMRTEPEPFNVGAGAAAGAAAGLIAYAWSDSLVEDVGEVARGAAMVTRVGRFAA